VKIAIVGSGPSGWATAHKLIELGFEITLIDSALGESDTHNLSKEQSSSKLSKKLYFGSDLPYRRFPFGPELIEIDVNPISSFTSGGLSLVWGATMLPYCKADTGDWPFDISILDSKFRELSMRIPITGNSDQLDAAYGKFFSRRGIFPSQRILQFMERACKHQRADSLIGLSRLAVETGTKDFSGCNYCNQCINGCPSNFIWNSKGIGTIGEHLKMRVLKLVEMDDFVKVEGLGLNGELISDLCFDKVFLAVGCIESFRILANSGVVGDSAVLKDSATFFLPLIAFPMLGASKSNSFGLSQCFIRLNENALGPASQFQLYEYSDYLLSRARSVLPLGGIIPTRILKYFLSKMVVAIGYLTGQESPSILLKLLEDGSVELTRNKNGIDLRSCKHSIKNAIIKLRECTKRTGLFPLSFLNQVAQPGEGVHFGGWLPMGKGSDLLGRPNGFQRIHVVDSSVLPSIAPGPITFTVMANAMRIAEESVK
jgi:hypothetical protein